jgi:hypothetical protein
VVQLPTAVQIQRNARRSRPRVPDTQLAIFWTVRRSNQSGFAPLGAGRNRAGTPGRCRRSKRARPALPRPPRPERRRTADPDWRRRGRARGHAGRRGPASIRMHPLLRRDLWLAVGASAVVPARRRKGWVRRSRRLVQKEFSVAERRFGILVDSHDDCLDVLVALTLARG